MRFDDGVGLKSLRGRNLVPAVTNLNRDISEEGRNAFRHAMDPGGAAEEPTDFYYYPRDEEVRFGGNRYVEGSVGVHQSAYNSTYK